MNSLLRIIIATIAITAVLSKQIDTRPRISDEKAAPIQNLPNRYVAEEVVIYLTPSQLQAIQEGKGFIDPEPSTTTETPEENQDAAESDQLEENDSSKSQTNAEDTQISKEDEDTVASSLPAEEVNPEAIEDDPQLSWIYRLLSNYPELINQPAELEVESGESAEDTKVESETNRPDTTQKQRFKLVPYEVATESSKPSTTEPTPNDPIKERWLRLLEQNRVQLTNAMQKQDKVTATTTTTTTTTTEQPQGKSESSLSKLRYSAKYKSKNQTNQKDQRSKSNLDKQKELTKAVVSVNDEDRKETKKAIQQQKSLIKQVRVHTPVFIPIPESARIPVKSPIALKGLKPVSIQKNRAGTKVTQKKPETQARAQNTEPKTALPKNVTIGVNNTYVVENRTSTDADKGINSRQKGKSERITIIRHLIDN